MNKSKTQQRYSRVGKFLCFIGLTCYRQNKVVQAENQTPPHHHFCRQAKSMLLSLILSSSKDYRRPLKGHSMFQFAEILTLHKFTFFHFSQERPFPLCCFSFSCHLPKKENFHCDHLIIGISHFTTQVYLTESLRPGSDAALLMSRT